MKTIFPEKLKLKKGDCIGILACAGSIDDIAKLENAKKFFEDKGFVVKISNTAYSKKQDYLCDTDEARAEALNSFFADESIDAILAARGGYGSLRILDKIDYELINSHPKIFAGYSDITAVSLMIYKKTGLVTYNAPMAIPDFGTEVDDYTLKSFEKMFIDDAPVEKLVFSNPLVYYPGKAKGVLWGGNLSTIQSLCGLDFLPQEKFIFAVEDINEPVYKIDKMFTQLLNINEFKKKLAGIVLGDFSGVDNQEWFENFFKTMAHNLKIPVVSGLKFGHEAEKETFSFGGNCTLDTEEGTVLFR